MTTYTPEEIKLEAALSAAANQEGTIQAAAMLRLAPHHRPELHTTMSVCLAFEALTGKTYDTDFFCD
jgi:predicted hydrolase (HD superfamily)